jgi:hypothetical protein
MQRDPYLWRRWVLALAIARNRAGNTGQRQRVVQDQGTRRWLILPAEVAEPCS